MISLRALQQITAAPLPAVSAVPLSRRVPTAARTRSGPLQPRAPENARGYPSPAEAKASARPTASPGNARPPADGRAGDGKDCLRPSSALLASADHKARVERWLASPVPFIASRIES